MGAIAVFAEHYPCRQLQAAGVSGIVGSLSSGVTTAVAESVTIPGGTVLVSPASTAPSISSLVFALENLKIK